MADRLVLLHCGAFKTGTSAQQAWLLENANLLNDSGFAYPVHLATPGGSSHKLANALMRRTISLTREDLSQLHHFKRFSKTTGTRDLLLSSESLSGEKALSGLDRVSRRLRRLRVAVRTTMFVRNQVAQLSSKYAQRARSLRTTSSFTDFLDQTTLAAADWLGHFKRHRAAGFEPRFATYRGRSGAPVAEALFTALGVRDRLPRDCDFSIGARNESGGQLAILAAVAMARRLEALRLRLDPQQQARFSGLFADLPEDLDPERFFGPTRADVSRIRTAYKASNLQMARELVDDGGDVLLDDTEVCDRAPSPRCWADLAPDQARRFDELVHLVQQRAAADATFGQLLAGPFLTERIRPE